MLVGALIMSMEAWGVLLQAVKMLLEVVRVLIEAVLYFFRILMRFKFFRSY